MMTNAPPPRWPAPDSCALCGDVAVEAEVQEPLDDCTARVRMEGCDVEIATDLVGPVSAGDRVLVHLGFAIARLEGAP